MRGYLRIVPLAPRGSNGLYVRRESADRLESPLSGPGVQETGCGTPWTQLATRIPKELHRRLKLHCVTHDTSVMDFVVEAIEEKLGRKTRPKKGTA